MADKTITYRLSADISSFSAKMAQAAASVKGAANEMTGATVSGQRFRAGLSTIGTVAGGIGLAAAAGLGAAVMSAANFDQAMSNVQAATHESAANMGLLRAAALKAGADTVFSATEAAQGIEALAKAGVSTKDVLGGGLRGALSLAAAGELDVGAAAEDAATAMTQFGLQGKDVPHIADLLAAAAGKAQGEVSDFAMALNQVGLVANSTGLSIEETTGALAAFASKGLIGSDAGTSFKTFLGALSGNSTQARELMDKLGFSAYDAQGKFVGLTEVADRLRKAFSGLTEEQRARDMKQIFGTDAIRAANVLYNEGADGIQKWINKVNDQGYAAETAATKLDNLKGDLEGLKGSLETAFIGTGEGAQSGLRTLTQSLTGLVNQYNDLSPAAHNAVAGTAGFFAVAGGGLFVISRLVSGVASMRATFSDLGQGFSSASKGMLAMRGAAGAAGLAVIGLSQSLGPAHQDLKLFGTAFGAALTGLAVGGPWGAAVGGAIGLIAGLGKAHAEAAGQVAALTATLDTETGAITKNTRAWVAHKLEQDGTLGTAKDLGLNLGQVTDAALGQADAINYLNARLEEQKEIARASGSHADYEKVKSLQALIATLGAQADQIDQLQAAKRREIAATNGLTIAQQKLADKYKLTPKTIKTAVKQVGMKEAERGLTALVKGYHLTPRVVATIVKQVGIKGALDLIDSLTKKYHLTPKQVSTALKQIGMGKSQSDIAKLLKQYGLTPHEVKTAINALDHASGVIAHVKANLASVHDKTVTLTTVQRTVSVTSPGGHGTPHDISHNEAAGGLIRGPGTTTSDSIPAMLSDREYVVNAAAVSKYGVDMLHSINAMRYAGGGMVGASSVTNAPVSNSRSVTQNFNGPITTLDVNAMARANETRLRDALALAASP